MTFAVIQVADFSLQALLRLKPALRGEPVGILSGEGRRAVIAHASPLAVGISPGMTAAQALAECPALQLLSPSLCAEREAGALLLTAAWTLSPLVEPTSAGLCTADISGLDRAALPTRVQALRAGLRLHGLETKVGIGPNPLVARFAAHLAAPERWVEDAPGFLASLPISLLELSEDEERLFSDLGLRTLGALTRFPRAALTNRLGARGDALWSLAAGEWGKPIQPAPFPVRHLAETDLEEAVETLDALLFVLRRFVDRLAAEVGQFGGGANRLSLVLRLDGDKTYQRDFDLPEPTAHADALFTVLEQHLSDLHTDDAIIGLSLEAFPARRLEQQAGLFETGLRDAPMFFATLGRLAAVVGNDNVGTPRRADSHQPDALLLTPPATVVPERVMGPSPTPHGPLLRRLRPTMAATVELTEARPTFLISPMVQGEITILRRPFWVNGDWWQPTAWALEEWDVQIGPGLYRLEHLPAGWFIAGIYD